eukprot:COSAG01_NODE_71530_length_255_cov_1.333333_1_plen_36_part_01
MGAARAKRWLRRLCHCGSNRNVHAARPGDLPEWLEH